VGEEHGLAETSSFWTGVCHAAVPEGFHTMAIEEGPLVAAELERSIRQPDGQSHLVAFEKHYPESINIYNTREEFGMLFRKRFKVSPCAISWIISPAFADMTIPWMSRSASLTTQPPAMR
jgi:hypothetical protein